MSTAPRNIHGLSEEDHANLARAVMKRQAALGLRVGAIFIVLVFGLPLVNFYLPGLANTPVLGFTATWFFLGILFFPITWLLSAYFIRQSDRIEDNCKDWRASTMCARLFWMTRRSRSHDSRHQLDSAALRRLDHRRDHRSGPLCHPH